jgi:hypothetical protein
MNAIINDTLLFIRSGQGTLTYTVQTKGVPYVNQWNQMVAYEIDIGISTHANNFVYWTNYAWHAQVPEGLVCQREPSNKREFLKAINDGALYEELERNWTPSHEFLEVLEQHGAERYDTNKKYGTTFGEPIVIDDDLRKIIKWNYAAGYSMIGELEKPLPKMKGLYTRSIYYIYFSEEVDLVTYLLSR